MSDAQSFFVKVLEVITPNILNFSSSNRLQDKSGVRTILGGGKIVTKGTCGLVECE